MLREVGTKKELKNAINDQVEIVVVQRELVEELRPLINVMLLPKKKVSSILTFLVTTGGILVAGLGTSPITGGVSGAVAVVTASPVVIAFAAKNKIEIVKIVGLLLLCASIGTAVILDILKDYDVSEIELEIGPVKFKRKAEKKK